MPSVHIHTSSRKNSRSAQVRRTSHRVYDTQSHATQHNTPWSYVFAGIVFRRSPRVSDTRNTRHSYFPFARDAVARRTIPVRRTRMHRRDVHTGSEQKHATIGLGGSNGHFRSNNNRRENCFFNAVVIRVEVYYLPLPIFPPTLVPRPVGRRLTVPGPRSSKVCATD